MHGSSWRSRSPVVTYLRGREHVLGGHRGLSRDPRQAAYDLVAERGLIGARAWLREVWRAVLREGEDDRDAS
jgi:hypothetical protein